MEVLENINRWIDEDPTGIVYDESLLNGLRNYQSPSQGMGLYQQMRQGNRVPYQELTRERIEEVFMGLFYNRSNNPDRRININLTQSQQDVFWQEMNPEPNIKISEIHFPF